MRKVSTVTLKSKTVNFPPGSLLAFNEILKYLAIRYLTSISVLHHLLLLFDAGGASTESCVCLWSVAWQPIFKRLLPYSTSGHVLECHIQVCLCI